MSRDANNGRSVLPQKCIDEIRDTIDRLDGVPGDIVEVGAFKCGTTMEMARKAPNRMVWALDAFGGAGRMDEFQEVSFEEVCKYVASQPNIRLIQGDIRVSAGMVNTDIAMLLLDCDLKEPAEAALNALLPHMVPGSKIIVDDMGFEGIRESVKLLEGWHMTFLPSGMGLFERA